MDDTETAGAEAGLTRTGGAEGVRGKRGWIAGKVWAQKSWDAWNCRLCPSFPDWPLRLPARVPFPHCNRHHLHQPPTATARASQQLLLDRPRRHLDRAREAPVARPACTSLSS
jgi:hypothetical protein